MSKRNFIECFPNEAGAFNIQNSNLWIKEIGTESDAMKVLIELVELKDMKDAGFPDNEEGAKQFAIYMSRKKLAWAAARKLIESKK